MEKHVGQFLLNAESKALATVSAAGTINVVPVSSLFIHEGQIILINYFMRKTLENILENNQVALVAWSRMIGYQIKGTVQYVTSGDLFDSIVIQIHSILPDRTVSGILIIKPNQVYDIAPDQQTDLHFQEYGSKK